MPELEYDDALDAEAQEWFRLRLRTEGQDVIGFTVQYETTISGQRVPVVRYDNAHGFVHRDLLDRRGRTVSKLLLAGDPTLKQAVTIAENDIRANWQTYRDAFFRDEL